jgi:hypothetical protein
MVAEAMPQTLMAAMRYYTPEVASAYIQLIKWPDGPVCPKCGSANVSAISRGRFQCRERECRHQTTLIAGTIFAGTHLPLEKWIAAVWMIVNCRNGVSSCEIARTIGCKQQSAWHVLHRVRVIMTEAQAEPFVGVVETDTTLVGGLAKFMSEKRRAALPKGRDGKPHRLSGKTIVQAIRERHTGRVRAQVIDRENAETVRDLIVRNVRPGSRLMTDSAHPYKHLKAKYTHESVNHFAGEYVRGDVTTNGCENFFNCLRRALKGTYIKATAEHLQPYVDEAAYRYNVRHLGEWDRFDAAMRQVVGKRLTYSELTGGAVR